MISGICRRIIPVILFVYHLEVGVEVGQRTLMECLSPPFLQAIGNNPFFSMMRALVRTAVAEVIGSFPLAENFVQDFSCLNRLSIGGGRKPRCAYTHCVGRNFIFVDLFVRCPQVI